MLLNISDRLALTSILPPTGDFTTLKDIRKLKEELAISQEDRKEVQFFNEYVCPKCQIKDTFSIPVKCGKCDVWMRPTGQIGCSNWEFTKEIPIPDYIVELIVATLKQMNDNKKLEERHLGIFSKFVEAKETI